MTREVIGTGVKRGGKVEWDDPRGFTDDLQFLKDGPVVVRVEVSTAKAIRSLQANKYYHGHVLKLMAEETGQDREDIHAAMCAQFLTRTVHLVNKRTGEVIEQTVPGRSSKLQPEEFWTFVEQVRLFAAEFLGITTRDPDPEWRRHREAA